MAAARADVGGRAAARVEAVLRRHHASLMWIARRWSGSRDEAEDALQRAMEIYLRRLDTIDPATEFAWLKVVVRHEALALRRAHAGGQPLDEDQLEDRLPAPEPDVEERAERAERNARSLEALAQLKPDERAALLLKGQGYSYREIGELKGWTYTKVNRAITEGRRRFLSVFASIESGEECLRFAPTLMALVQGDAASADVIALRPHLRHCAGCRATIRELHASRLHRLALHLPFLAGVAPVRWLGDRVAGIPDPPRADPKGLIGGALNRLSAPDVAAGVQMASSGGGRGPAVAALLGLCLSGGAGTYCLATGRPARPDGHRAEVRGREEVTRQTGGRAASHCHPGRGHADGLAGAGRPAHAAQTHGHEPGRTPAIEQAAVPTRCPPRRPGTGVRLRVLDGLEQPAAVLRHDRDHCNDRQHIAVRAKWRLDTELVAAADERRGVPAVKKSLLALALAVLAPAFPAAPARAGTYDVWSCRLPRAPLDGWRLQRAGTGANQCPGFGFSANFPNSAMAATLTTGWTFEAPRDLSIDSYELYRAARSSVGSDGTNRVYALYHDEAVFDPLVYLFEYCAPSAGCYQQGRPYPASPMDPANRVVRTGLSAKRLILRMECHGPYKQPTTCGAADVGGGFGIARARITLRDALPPVLAPPAGPLASAGAVLEGLQAVTLKANDEGGGVQRLGVFVDGKPALEETLEDEAPHCRTPFAKTVPCPLSTTRTLAFDTATVPNGRHAIQLAAYDAAGNRTLSPAVLVTTLNGMTPNGVHATRRATLVAGFPTRGRPAAERATVGFGARRAIRGRLTDADGKPIGRAKLEVTAQNLRRKARPRSEAIVQTGDNGRFRYLPHRGPSRILRFEYRAFSLDAAPSAVTSLKLRVRAGIRLRVRPRRTTSRGQIRFAGKLLGGPGRKGVQVTLYAVGRVGRARVPVSVMRAGRRGRFRFQYRFVRTFAPFTYRFQARLAAQPTYPYAAAGSNRVTVRVTR